MSEVAEHTLLERSILFPLCCLLSLGGKDLQLHVVFNLLQCVVIQIDCFVFWLRVVDLLERLVLLVHAQSLSLVCVHVGVDHINDCVNYVHLLLPAIVALQGIFGLLLLPCPLLSLLLCS